MIEGPKNQELGRTLPKELEIVSVLVEDRVAYVYTHENVPLNMHGNYSSSTATTMIVDSIAATLILNEQFGN